RGEAMQQSPYVQAETQNSQPEPFQEVDVYVEETEDEQRITYIRKLPGRSNQEPNYTRRISNFLLYVGYLAACWLVLCIPSSAATAILPIVTVTIIPKMQTITTTQTIELPARLFAPLTLTQSQTVKT